MVVYSSCPPPPAQLLRVAGRHAAADMHAMRSDLDAAYAALRCVGAKKEADWKLPRVQLAAAAVGCGVRV